MTRTDPISKFASKIRERGVATAFKVAIVHLVHKIAHSFGMVNPIIEKHRGVLSLQIDKMLNSTVAYGPFKGFKLAPVMLHGGRDRAAMLLGLYEQEILTSLSRIPSNYRVFIDLGAADGYYGIGVLVNGMFDKSYCFEMSVECREIIKQNAIMNRVAERVEIKGTATRNFYEDLPSDEIVSSVLLVDIEGGEFDLFDKATFNEFRHSIIFIELHNSLSTAGQFQLQKLKNDANDTHLVSEFTTTGRDLSGFDELKTFSDSDRWLISSEGRPRLMSWLRLDPRTKSADLAGNATK
jgi:hypothetical protein